MKVFPPAGFRFEINASCEVNDTNFDIMGKGLIKPLGVYSCKLEFSKIPPNFHPVIVSGYLVSICCGYASAMRNKAENMLKLGVNRYSTVRKMTLANGGRIKIDADVVAAEDRLEFNGKLNGICNVPKDIVPFAYYNAYWVPEGSGKIVGKGLGSFFRINGEEIRVKVASTYSYDSKVALKKAQFGIISENGSLDGLVYTCVLHSVRDRENTMAKLMSYAAK